MMTRIPTVRQAAETVTTYSDEVLNTKKGAVKTAPFFIYRGS